MDHIRQPRSYESRDFQQLSSKKPSEWSDIELRTNHRIMSDLSPWLNEQGTHIHSQIIQEIERRGQLT